MDLCPPSSSLPGLKAIAPHPPPPASPAVPSVPPQTVPAPVSPASRPFLLLLLSTMFRSS